MTSRPGRATAVAVLGAAVLGLPAVLAGTTGHRGEAATTRSSPARPDAATKAAAAAEAFAQSSLSFEPNVGQADPGVAFVARGLGHALSLSPTEAVLSAGESAVRMRLVDASPSATVSGRSELEGRINYYVGDDPAHWRSDVPTYGSAAHEGVWPGIDLVWHESSAQALEYDFVVVPGADPMTIAVAFDGAKALRLDGQELVVETEGAELRQHAPVVYQDKGGRRVEVAGRFVLDGSTVRFSVGAYDASLPLVIDPVLAWSTYLGGTVAPFGDEYGNDIAVDDLGSAYVTGLTCTASFPETTYAYQKTLRGGCDAFVTKFIPTVNTGVGTGLKYSTFLGGSGSDEGLQIALDAERNAYVVGDAGSTDFPTTVGAYQRTGGGTFVAKLNKKGLSLLYSTRLSAEESGNGDTKGLALGPPLAATPTQRTVYVMGNDTGPTPTPDAFQSECGIPEGTGGDPASCDDMWLAKLNPVAGGAADLVYATYLGGIEPGRGGVGGLAVDGDGRAYLAVRLTTSSDWPIAGANGSFDADTGDAPGCVSPPRVGYVAQIDPSLPADGTGQPSPANQQLVWSTYVQSAAIYGVALGPGGTVYLSGTTTEGFGGCETPYPTTPGAFDTVPGCPGYSCRGLLAKLDSSLPGDGSGIVSATNQQLVYSSYVGEFATGWDIAVDSTGRAWIAGDTASASFPRKNPLQATCGCFFSATTWDGFVVGIDPAGNGSADLVFGTFLGGRLNEALYGIALDAAGSVYVVGASSSYKNSHGNAKADRYPVTPNAYQLNNPGSAAGEFPQCRRSNSRCSDAVVSKISGL